MELTTPFVDVLGLQVRFRRVGATVAVRLNAAASAADDEAARLDAALDTLAHIVGDVRGVTVDGEPLAFPATIAERREFLDSLGLPFVLAASHAGASALSPTEAQQGK